MSTHALTKVVEDNQVLVAMYTHWSGYPSGFGKELYNFLKDITLVNGLGGDNKKVANGAGCAYKDGTGKVFTDEKSAKEFSKNIEKSISNEDEVNEYEVKISQTMANAYEIWQDSLRDEFPGISEDIFNICLSEAYDRGHSAGCDEVASIMYGIVDFANKILEVAKS